MFRAGLLLIIRRTNSVQTAIGIVMPYVDRLLASCWFMFYICITMHGQQDIKFEF